MNNSFFMEKERNYDNDGLDPSEEYDPTCYGERGGRYYERISKNGRRYRQYF